MSDKNKTIPLPEPYSRQKLAALYRTLSISNETVKLLRKYLKAMTNLYGVIPLDKVYEIISSQNPGLLTEAEFIEYIMVARHEQEYFAISGRADLYTGSRFRSLKERELIDIILLFDDEEFLQRTFQMQADKPYYIPEKNILLRYHDEFYAEPTPQSKAMKRFLQDKLHFDAEGAQNIFIDLLLITRGADFSINDISKYLEDNKLIFTSTNDAEEFFNLYTDLHNHTRMQYNRGHTPSEIAAMTPHHEYGVKSISFGPNILKQIQNETMDYAELFNRILTMELPSEDLRKNMLAQLAELKKEMSADSPALAKQVKVGRNDPCPCGSGKKYKKCCGK